MKQEPIDLPIDDIWAPNEAFQGKVKPRRVLAVGNGHVIYSDGSRKTKECKVTVFSNWIRKYSCLPNRYRKS